jgi:tetratricopeptide (TPR) repeat protein
MERAGHWLAVRVVGDPSAGTTADAIGTRLTLVTGGTQQIRERDGGSGFASQSDPRLHFGLGDHAVVELLEIRWPDGGLQYLEDVAADRILTVRQDPARYAANSRIAVGAPRVRGDAAPRAAPQPPPLDPQELERLLALMERELAAAPGHALARDYRQRCVENGRHDRAIQFFERAVADRPEDPWARLELSVAYVDKIPTCGGIAAIVCKGTLARKSLDQLDALIGGGGDGWLPRYARGMNHLHWPKALRHSPEAVADFDRCLTIQRDEGRREPAFERTYVLLGDAYAKNGAPEEARRTWREGLAAYPGSAALAERAGLPPARVLAYVEDRRSLEQPIDTDLSFFEPRPR